MNVAHQEIDLARPKDNHNNAGFTAPERDSFSVLLKSGFIDCYREQNPGKQEYTWWSNHSQARSKNIGWRIDYFLVDYSLRKNYSQANILSSVMGSDHCPFELTVKFWHVNEWVSVADSDKKGFWALIFECWRLSRYLARARQLRNRCMCILDVDRW